MRLALDLGEPFDPGPVVEDDRRLAEMASAFCDERPYAVQPFSKRNWGGTLHSLCSYQGKLKPSIAHFLIRDFTRPGQTVLDPMSGVGTIPLEARRQGRVPVASDLSELAVCVSRAKIMNVHEGAIRDRAEGLASYIAANRATVDKDMLEAEDVGFGLNGSIKDYFHGDTLAEIVLARRFFRDEIGFDDPAGAVVLTSIAHILHGNRPYALSRRSHPITPLKPTGEAEYRGLVDRLSARLDHVVPELGELENAGRVFRCDFAEIPVDKGSVDAVITSPPFADSLRFYSSNWMRLWLCGWRGEEFKTRPKSFLEAEQKDDFESAYRRFIVAMSQVLRRDGLLIMHLGATKKLDMAKQLEPLLAPEFKMVFLGVEALVSPETHGLSDKGATTRHTFMFCRRS